MFKAVEKSEKVSQNIISQIRDTILSGQLKPGQRIASEKELWEQFSVSKSTMREAVRVLEAMGLLEIRKGLGGGVFVAEVDMETTITSIANFLHFKSPSISDLTMVRYMIEPPMVELIASKIQPTDIDMLESLIPEKAADLHISFHRYLARLSENPVLILIMDFIDNILTKIKIKLNLPREFYENVAKGHRRVVECLARKDGPGARKEIIRDLIEVGKYMAERAGEQMFDLTICETSDILSEEIYRAIEPNQAQIDSLSLKRLAALLGEENAVKLKESGMLFRQVGSGNLYLIDREDKDQ